jgi:hypothetical protein
VLRRAENAQIIVIDKQVGVFKVRRQFIVYFVVGKLARFKLDLSPDQYDLLIETQRIKPIRLPAVQQRQYWWYSDRFFLGERRSKRRRGSRPTCSSPEEAVS